MERVRKNRNSGLTLVEVMIAMLVIMIIVIGAISYMGACMWNARRAEVRITATRVGQLLLERWKLTGSYDVSGNWSWHVDDFDPTDPEFSLTLPDIFESISADLGGEGVELGDYEIAFDEVHYFVTLLYDNSQPQMLSARVAWNRDYGSQTPVGNFDYIDLTSYAIY
jgi:type II secretory pathway pseudopilin PulG